MFKRWDSAQSLRSIAVKDVLRKKGHGYLLRQGLGKQWVVSDACNEYAWTDFKRIFMNLNKMYDKCEAYPKGLTQGEVDTIITTALCHEVLHNLWMHNIRGKGMLRQHWLIACEWSINKYLSDMQGLLWCKVLDVMYPPVEALDWLAKRKLPATTDNFYQYLVEEMTTEIHLHVHCGFCAEHDGHKPEEDDESPSLDPRMLQLVLSLPEHDEKKELLKFMMDAFIKPQKVPWEQLLMGGIEEAVSQELSWQTPSRRHDEMPGWRREKLLSFVWVLDISPSINDEMKLSFIKTLNAAINMYHDASHRVIFFSEGIDLDVVIPSGGDASMLEMMSGNGTDLDEVWTVLEKDKPDYALILTDLELCEVPKPSHTHTVWGVVGNYEAWHPDYGTYIKLD